MARRLLLHFTTVTKQDPASTNSEPGSSPVVVHVWVENERGGPVQRLLPDDFEVYEQERRHDVAFFAEQSGESTLPASIVIAVDTDRLRRATLDRLKESLWRFVRELPANTELALATARGETIEVGTLNASRDAAKRDIASLDRSKTSQLRPLLSRSLEVLTGTTRLRKILIVVQPGFGHGEIGLTDELILRLRASQAVLFIVSLRPHSFRSGDLFRLTSDSGGQVFLSTGPQELPRSFRALLQALRYHYVLGYFVTHSPSGPRSRSVEVRLRASALSRGALRLRARREYLA
jgi:VWFA-related protein